VQKWLEIMGYPLNEIKEVRAIKMVYKSGDIWRKTDVQVQVKIIVLTNSAIGIENISIKLVSNPHGFNQVDKRRVANYKDLWNMPDEIMQLMKFYTGETKPRRKMLRDSRRMFFDEMTKVEQNKILKFFKDNKILIVSDVLKGRGKISAGWMLVILKTNRQVKWTLKNINEVMNLFGEGEVRFTHRGSMKIGRITMQRKGGDAGRGTAKMLQFKINPIELFENSR